MWGEVSVKCRLSRAGYTNKQNVYVHRLKLEIMGDGEEIPCAPELYSQVPEGNGVLALVTATVVRKKGFGESAPAFRLGAVVRFEVVK